MGRESGGGPPCVGVKEGKLLLTVDIGGLLGYGKVEGGGILGFSC